MFQALAAHVIGVIPCLVVAIPRCKFVEEACVEQVSSTAAPALPDFHAASIGITPGASCVQHQEHTVTLRWLVIVVVLTLQAFFQFQSCAEERISQLVEGKEPLGLRLSKEPLALGIQPKDPCKVQ